MIEKSGKKIEKSDIKSEKKPRMKDLILNRIKAFPNRNNNLWSEQIENKSRSKTRNKSEKPNKLERIMQIKIKKPKVLSVVKTYICEKNEFQIRKKSKSPLIEKKIIEEDINCLKKDINKIDKHQNKLEFIFAKEVKHFFFIHFIYIF